MSHINGLVATKELSNPFDYCDVVSSTTHKTLRGPRAGIIFYRKELEEKINFSVFPMLQGGPHQHQIAGIAHQMLEVSKPEFVDYIKQVKKNINTLSDYLISKGYKLATDGTDTHLILVDLKNKGVTGSKIEYICSYVDISINKNSVYGDKSALSPGGIRIGSCALTTRGFKEKDFLKIGELLDRVIGISLEIQKEGSKLSKFKENVSKFDKELDEIREEVHSLTGEFEFYE
jgi:glycine hydroxymethyltransferase